MISGRYVAPEVFRNEEYDVKVDVFSFALIVQEVYIIFLTLSSIIIMGRDHLTMIILTILTTDFQINTKILKREKTL
jgi:serine/threonine protein kinase